MFEVKRHGGKVTDVYRLIASTEDEEKARGKFNRVVAGMRQGGVMLLRDGVVIDEVTAPNLISRW